MEEKISFYSGPGYKLAGRLWLPDDVKKGEKLPAVVMLPGYHSTGVFVPSMAAKFIKSRYAVATFSHRGFGESEGPRWRHIAREQVEDAIDAVTYMTSRSDVDPNRIGLLGMSYGGANCIVTAAFDNRVKCVVSLVPFSDGERVLHHSRPEWEWANFLKRIDEDRKRKVVTGKSELVIPEDILLFDPASREFFATMHDAAMRFPLSETAYALMNHKPIEHVHKISPRALLIIAAENDYILPIEEAYTLYERAKPPKKLIVYKNTPHYDIVSSEVDRTIDLSLEWFKKYLETTENTFVAEETRVEIS